jgi:hypothetical protein
LPQPDGPTKTRNSPCSTSILMLPSATTCSWVRSMCQTLPISLSRKMVAITLSKISPGPSFSKRGISLVGQNPPLTKGIFLGRETYNHARTLIINIQKFESNITKSMPGKETCNYFDSSEAPSLLGICTQMFRRPQDGGDNILIAGTPANVAAQVLAYLFF